MRVGFSRLGIPALRWLTSGVLVTVIIVSSGQAFYLSGKAWLAQRLLQIAWNESHSENVPIKPWPWADIHPEARLEVPRLGITQVVLNDHSGESLAFGPGMAEANGAIILAGHRDSHFTFLKSLVPGDRIKLQRAGKPGRGFRVTATQILDTRLQEQVIPSAGTLLLMTCFPFDALSTGGPLRYVVVARVDATKSL